MPGDDANTSCATGMRTTMAGIWSLAMPTTDGHPQMNGLAAFLRDLVGDPVIEKFAVAGLSASGQLVCVNVAEGEQSMVPDVLPAVKRTLADVEVCSIILAHNHPDDSARPSSKDKLTTDRIAALARLSNATLIDHLIFGRDGVFSMGSNRLLGSLPKVPDVERTERMPVPAFRQDLDFNSWAAQVADLAVAALVVLAVLLPFAHSVVTFWQA